MGIVIKWALPDTSEVSYTNVSIERSASESGTYAEVANQLIADNTYFDVDGSTSNWYRIRFYTGTDYSEYSEVIQGGTWVGYCSPDDIRRITDITTTDLTDTQLWDLIQFAQSMMNKEICSKIIEERVAPVGGDERQNKIDGSNTDYYVQRSYTSWIGDSNGDGEVNGDDVVVWEYDSTNDTKTKLTVSSVSAELGKITLSSAPESGMDLTITYWYSPVDMNTPEPIVKTACAYLVASLGYTKLEAKDFDRMSIGKLSLAKRIKTFNTYYNKYREVITMIKSKMLRRVNDRDKYIYP